MILHFVFFNSVLLHYRQALKIEFFFPMYREFLCSTSSSSSAHYSSLLTISRHLAQSSATRIQLLPVVLCKSSLHLAWGRPTLRLPRRGLHSRTRLSVVGSTADMTSQLPLQHANTVCFVGDFSSLQDHLGSDSIPQRNPERCSLYSSLSDLELEGQPTYYHSTYYSESRLFWSKKAVFFFTFTLATI
jgi:hypothetical protein